MSAPYHRSDAMTSCPPPAVLLLLAGAACDGGLPGRPGPPVGTYAAILTVGDQANVGDARFLAYTSRSANDGCEPAFWVEAEGICSFAVQPDALGFAPLPAPGDPDGPLRCSFDDERWVLEGGNLLVQLDGDPTLQIAADRACPLLFADLVGTDCREEVFVRVELTLAERSASGVLEEPLIADPNASGELCGPAWEGIDR